MTKLKSNMKASKVTAKAGDSNLDHMWITDSSYSKRRNLRSMVEEERGMKMKNIIQGSTHNDWNGRKSGKDIFFT